MFERTEFQDQPRNIRLAIYRDLQQRAVDIVTVSDPEPVLGAEIEAQITESTPTVTTAEWQVLRDEVEVGSAVALALGKAVDSRRLVMGSRGDQPTYRLPLNPEEAGHVTT